MKNFCYTRVCEHDFETFKFFQFEIEPEMNITILKMTGLVLIHFSILFVQEYRGNDS